MASPPRFSPETRFPNPFVVWLHRLVTMPEKMLHHDSGGASIALKEPFNLIPTYDVRKQTHRCEKCPCWVLTLFSGYTGARDAVMAGFGMLPCDLTCCTFFMLRMVENIRESELLWGQLGDMLYPLMRRFPNSLTQGPRKEPHILLRWHASYPRGSKDPNTGV